MRYLPGPDGSYEHFDESGYSTRGVYVRDYDLRRKDFDQRVRGGGSGSSSSGLSFEGMGLLLVLCLFALAFVPFCVGHLSMSDIKSGTMSQLWSLRSISHAFPGVLVMGGLYAAIIPKRLRKAELIAAMILPVFLLAFIGPERAVIIGYLLLLSLALIKQSSKDSISAGCLLMGFLLVSVGAGAAASYCDFLMSFSKVGVVDTVLKPLGGVVLLALILPCGIIPQGLGCPLFLLNSLLGFLCVGFFGDESVSADVMLRPWRLILIFLAAASLLHDEYDYEEGGPRIVTSNRVVILGLILMTMLESAIWFEIIAS